MPLCNHPEGAEVWDCCRKSTGIPLYAQRETMPSYVQDTRPLTSGVQARINDLLARRHTMKELYLPMKHKEEDWHGVQDAASDLRDIDAELKGLRWVLGEGE